MGEKRRRQIAERNAAIKAAARRRVEAVWDMLGCLVSRSDAQSQESTSREGFGLDAKGRSKSASDTIKLPRRRSQASFGRTRNAFILTAPWCFSRERLRKNSTSFSSQTNESLASTGRTYPSPTNRYAC